LTLDLLAALAKLLLFAGALISAGTALAWASLGDRLGGTEPLAPRLVRRGAAVAGGASVAGVVVLLLQLGGDLDGPTVAAVLASPTGLAAGLRIAGAMLLLAAARGPARRTLRLLGAGAMLLSFGVTGHAAAAAALAGVVAAAHVAAAAWWLGGLLLLRRACLSLSAEALAALVGRFSRLALPVVGGMAAAGTVLVFVLVKPTLDAWLTAYGLNLAVKLALAGAALGIAARNRTRLAPRLASGGVAASGALRRALALEIALVAGALAATAWLTTFHSPHGAH